MTANKMNKKANIPITLLVILAVALFAFTLLALSVSSGKIYKKIEAGYLKVQEFNADFHSAEFFGRDANNVRVEGIASKYFGLGKEKTFIVIYKQND